MRFPVSGRSLARLALGAGLLLGGLTASGPASAATSSCGSNQVCLYTGTSGTGSKLVVTGDRATLGSFDLAVSSFVNNTNKALCGYPSQNFVAGRAPVDYLISDRGGVPFLDGFDNKLRSVELVSNALDCGLPYDHPVWAGVPQHRPATGSGTGFGDLNHDGYADLMVTDKVGGLWSLSGAPGGPARLLSTGWGSYGLFARHGDLNGDGREDFLARDAANVLWLYPGRGDGTFGTRVRVGSGWTYTRLFAMGDLNGDGRGDLYATDSLGQLWLYLGNGNGTFQPRRQVGTGWKSLTAIVPVGDVTGDGKADVFVRDATNHGWIYPGRGNGTVSSSGRTAVPGSWAWVERHVLGSVGDVTGDGATDLTAFAGTVGNAGTWGQLRSLPGYAGGTFGASTGPAAFGLRTTSVTF